jgi:hypothetical protein
LLQQNRCLGGHEVAIDDSAERGRCDIQKVHAVKDSSESLPGKVLETVQPINSISASRLLNKSVKVW